MRIPVSLFLIACSPVDPGLVDAGASATLDGGAVERDAAATDAASPAADAGPPRDVPPGCPFGGRPPVDDAPLAHASGRTETVRAGGFVDEYLYDATDRFKIGIRREWGGSVVFFGEGGGRPGANPTNTIDAADTGREVQIALYDPDRHLQGCAWDASCASGGMACPEQIRYLGWNPVQGGNRCNQGSAVDRVAVSGGGLVATVVPLQWNPDWAARDCTTDTCRGAGARATSDVRVTQTARFVRPRVVELRYRIENLADVDHRPTAQELPTMYSSYGRDGSQDLWRLMDPSGAQIPIDTPTGGDGFFYENFTASGPWVSLQNDDLSHGVGILYENGLRDFQGWQQRSLPFNNVRSRVVFGLPARGVVHARAYLLLGSFATIAAEAASVLAAMPPFGWLDGPAAEVGAGPTPIHGWALDNRGVTAVEARIDERVTVPLSYGASRPDVCLAWPGYPRCDAVGFAGSHDFGPPTACPHLVEIIATDADGNRRTIAERLVTVR
ncbi:MAG: hypothetical protein KF729_12265 [Sandaracinaceae bacterium]|nr:hypothetical protein [Sandaracinaceae bacterium]MBX3271030.1 hypothetical protein [Sandaracinaceae bacterium]